MAEDPLGFQQTSCCDEKLLDCRARMHTNEPGRALLTSYLGQRHGTRPDALSIEFCTEVTKGSEWLADFGPVIITDYSFARREHAEPRREQRKRRISFRSIRCLADLVAMPPCDLLYSVLPARTSPVSVPFRLLELLLEKVVPNGLALLVIPTRAKNSHLMASLDEPVGTNNIPQQRIYDTLSVAGFLVVIAEEMPELTLHPDYQYHAYLSRRLPLDNKPAL